MALGSFYVNDKTYFVCRTVGKDQCKNYLAIKKGHIRIFVIRKGSVFLSLSSLGLISFGLTHSLISVSLISLGLKRYLSRVVSLGLKRREYV